MAMHIQSGSSDTTGTPTYCGLRVSISQTHSALGPGVLPLGRGTCPGCVTAYCREQRMPPPARKRLFCDYHRFRQGPGGVMTCRHCGLEAK